MTKVIYLSLCVRIDMYSCSVVQMAVVVLSCADLTFRFLCGTGCYHHLYYDYYYYYDNVEPEIKMSPSYLRVYLVGHVNVWIKNETHVLRRVQHIMNFNVRCQYMCEFTTKWFPLIPEINSHPLIFSWSGSHQLDFLLEYSLVHSEERLVKAFHSFLLGQHKLVIVNISQYWSPSLLLHYCVRVSRYYCS